MDKEQKEKIPVLSLSGTASYAFAEQIINGTDDAIFGIKESTPQETINFVIIKHPLKDSIEKT